MLNKTLPALLKEKGWSQSKLARESGVSVATLHGWIQGRKVADIAQLRRVSEALEVPLFRLAFGEPDPFEDTAQEVLKEIFAGDIRVTLHRIERRKKA